MGCSYRISMHIRTEHFPTDGVCSPPYRIVPVLHKLWARRQQDWFLKCLWVGEHIGAGN